MGELDKRRLEPSADMLASAHLSIVVSDRVLRWSSALLWTIGAVIGAVGCLLPHGTGVLVAGWWALVVVAAAMGVWSWWSGPSLPLSAQYAMSVVACTAVTLALLCAHHSTTVYLVASLYVLTMVYTASFYETTPFVVYLACQVVASGAVLLTSGLPAALAGWVVLMGTSATAGVTIHLLRRALTSAADTDPLTGLPNRRSMERAIIRELAKASRRDEVVSVALVDLDEFKEVNDRLGHAEGDRVLIEVAAAWSRQLRAGDVLGRMGGDEFVLLLPASTAEDASRVIERCRHASRQPFSAGVAEAAAGSGLDGLLRRADDACYASKRTGGTTAVADPEPEGTHRRARGPDATGGDPAARPPAASPTDEAELAGESGDPGPGR